MQIFSNVFVSKLPVTASAQWRYQANNLVHFSEFKTPASGKNYLLNCLNVFSTGCWNTDSVRIIRCCYEYKLFPKENDFLNEIILCINQFKNNRNIYAVLIYLSQFLASVFCY